LRAGDSYSLRHTGARWLRKQGVSEWDTQTQLGHRQQGSTETYTAYDPEYLEAAAEAPEELVRANCAPLPFRRKGTVIRSRKEIMRENGGRCRD